MGTNPTDPVNLGSNKPVDHVHRADAVAFCEKLSAKFGRMFRLPTGAEWERACRAGGQTAFSYGDDVSRLHKYAWYDQGVRISHDCGMLLPNAWGLFDMNGNLWEWISDRYGTYPSTPQTDPAGPDTGADGDMRGGCAYNGDTFQRCSSRHAINTGYTDSAIGFRVLLEA
jgi:formylglycine-generating enzyme required for sulfatase activity